MKARVFNILLPLAILGLIAGAYGVYEALFVGLKVMNLTSYVIWGLGTSVYLFFLGLAGVDFVANVLVYFFGYRQYEELGRLTSFFGLVCAVCAGIAITLDLGHWERLYNVFLTPSFFSPMIWEMILVGLMMLLMAVKLYFLIRNDLGKARLASYLIIPFSILFYLVNGALFGIHAGRPLWHGAMTSFLFLAAALLSGATLLTIIVLVFRPDEALIKNLGRNTLFFLFLFLLVLFIQGLMFVISLRQGLPALSISLTSLLFGSYWWTFWLVHILLGSLIPFYLLAAKGDRPSGVAWACALILIGLVAARFDFVVPGLSLTQIEGLETAFHDFRLTIGYAPNLSEWLETIFVFSLCLLAFLIGPRILPVAAVQRG